MARIVFASDTRGHTVGYHVVAQGLRDAGFDVIVAGTQLPNETVKTALEEDADLIAIRVMDRDPVELVSMLLSLMREQGIADVPVIAGGIISNKDAVKLRELGAVGVFGPGSKLAAIAACAREAIAVRRDMEKKREGA